MEPEKIEEIIDKIKKNNKVPFLFFNVIPIDAAFNGELYQGFLSAKFRNEFKRNDHQGWLIDEKLRTVFEERLNAEGLSFISKP